MQMQGNNETSKEKRTEFASKGGKARANVLTPEERKEIARNAVLARWEKAGKARQAEANETVELDADAQETNVDDKTDHVVSELPYSMFQGTLDLGERTVNCYVLNDLRRVISQSGIVSILGGGRDSGNLQRYLQRNPLFSNGYTAGPTIAFVIPGNPTEAIGYDGTVLIEICSKYLEAREQNLLRPNQQEIAKRCEIVIRSCAKLGIIALIDEATGYQEFRAKNALQLKFKAFIADELQEWAQMFPTEFWIELARLEGVHYSPRNRPLRWGKYIMIFVYDAIDSDVGKYLREKNPNPHFLRNHHQWLKKYGRDKVHDQIERVVTIMKLCNSMDEFKRRFARVFAQTYQYDFLDIMDEM
jgi:hypothetical protein